MDVRNCKQCRKIFNYVAGPVVCPACREKNEEQFQVCRKYVSDHKGISIAELSEACDVDVQLIRQWLREERLQFAEGALLGLECEKCGVTITSGRFCAKCKNEITNALGSAYASAPKPEPEVKKSTGSAKMRFMDK